MLAKDPNDRYRTAEQLIEAIDGHDPGARPRTSGSRPIPSIPSVPLGQPKSSNSGDAVRPGVGLKWALVGGIAAIGAFGVVWMTQQGNKIALGGGGASVTAPRAPTPVVSDLETALSKPSRTTPVGVSNSKTKLVESQPSSVVTPKNIAPVTPPVPIKTASSALPKPNPVNTELAEKQKKAEIISSILDEGDSCYRVKKFECAIANANAALRIVENDQRAVTLRENAFAGQKKALESATVN
jgi:hypothetical protein